MSAGAPTTLSALIDTLLPGAPADTGGRAYPSASAIGLDREIPRRVAALSRREQEEFAQLLRALDSPFLNLLLSGRPARFSRLAAKERERYLLGWAHSRLALKRKGFHAIKRLTAGLYFSAPIPGGGHPLWERIHYQAPEVTDAGADPLGALAPVRPDSDLEETSDVCVIGSGAGGGVISARLAGAGYRVTILEAGPWTPHAAFPRVEREANDRLFVNRGLLTTRDGAFGLLAGEGVGGGTAINWMTCLPPRPEARLEWARDGGMADVEGPGFDQILTAVGQRLHVSTSESELNASNATLRRGCEALGYRQGVDWDVIPRNSIGCAARCGFCTFGCPYAARQSGAVTYLLDALRTGARLFASTRAEAVEVEGGQARGVRAVYRGEGTPRNVHVRARAVVVAAGALQTPALLLRSGIRHRGVGAGLRLDPTTALAGEFPDPVRTWVGPHQTIRVSRFQAADPAAHGPWIEVAPAHPGLSAIALPWAGAGDFLRLLERSEHVATPIVLVRDHGEGRVSIDPDGRPVVDYVLSRPDRSNLVQGVVETARILRAAGATRLLSLQTRYAEAGDGRRPVAESELESFIAAVEREGIRENAVALFSAHPMGSARAGTDPRTSAARPTGEVHGVEGLWIGDGSLLPSAPGANPMISILAISWRTAGHILDSLRGSDARAR